MTIYRMPGRKTAFLASLCMVVPLLVTGCSSNSTGSTSVQNQNDGPGENGDSNLSADATAPGATTQSLIGEVLVFGDTNRTLYTFANDGDGKSNCNGGCAEVWPPVTASEAAVSGDFTTIERDDRVLQWAFKGRPLYYYQGDAVAGEINGEGINGVWYVARPDPIKIVSRNSGDLFVASGSINNGTGDAADRTNAEGLTLYTFRNDFSGVSSCNGGCALAWPPLYADQGVTANNEFSIISRADSTRQWAYNGQALYFYQGDTVPGDTFGDGVNGVWDVAVPDTTTTTD